MMDFSMIRIIVILIYYIIWNCRELQKNNMDTISFYLFLLFINVPYKYEHYRYHSS
jgi:hypothetical protein